jgi:hypothetical protein
MKILNRFTGAVIYEDDAATIRETVENAVRAGVSLDGASLVGARLVGASLVGARLVGARLDGASLDGASLDGARLDRASLDGASLVGASLVGVRLVGADLATIRADLFEVLAWAEPEIPALVAALTEGRVNGSAYSGECACLVGTIANARGCGYKTLPHDGSRLIERWFLAIQRGTPVDHPVVAITLSWIAEYQAGAR